MLKQISKKRVYSKAAALVVYIYWNKSEEYTEC